MLIVPFVYIVINTINQFINLKIDLFNDLWILVTALMALILGVFSFAKKYLEPGLLENKETWKNLTKKISEELLIEFHYQIDQKRKIRDSDLRKLRCFVDDIINDKEYLRFSFPQRGIFEKRKQKIKMHFQQLILLISYQCCTLEADQ